MKCKSNGRFSRKSNQVALLDIHKGIFSLDLNILFFEGVPVKNLITCDKHLHIFTYVCLCNKYSN